MAIRKVTQKRTTGIGSVGTGMFEFQVLGEGFGTNEGPSTMLTGWWMNRFDVSLK